MKQEFKQIYHKKTESGWKPASFAARVVLHPEDAAAINRRFEETGIKCVPISTNQAFSPRDRQQYQYKRFSL